MLGHLTLERRRLMALAGQRKAEHPEQFGLHAEALLATVRAAGIDRGVNEAVDSGRRAVALAERGADDVLVAALATLARALYLAGELDEAWAAALRAVEHPDAAQRAPGHALARSTLAFVAVDRGRPTSARNHAEQARTITGRISSSRSWLGANAAVATGAVLAGEGDLAGAEREFAYAEQFLRDEVATIHHVDVLVRLADVRCRRGRLDDAEAALRQAQDALSELRDSGTVPALAADVEKRVELDRRRASNGTVLQRPSEAEFAVLRLLTTDLSAREANTVRSHTRAIYRKLGVGSRESAVARASALGMLQNPLSPM
jgi:LuxR family maltose regulon positive regulatory protein